MTSGLRYGVEVRSAQVADAPEFARLLGNVSARDMAERLELMRAHSSGAVLVATGYSGLSGIIALGWAPVLYDHRPVAHITALVVDPAERRRGIGRLLLKAASQAARTAGCYFVELAAGPGQDAVEAFCLKTGFTPRGAVFGRLLRKTG